MRKVIICVLFLLLLMSTAFADEYFRVNGVEHLYMHINNQRWYVKTDMQNSDNFGDISNPKSSFWAAYARSLHKTPFYSDSSSSVTIVLPVGDHYYTAQVFCVPVDSGVRDWFIRITGDDEKDSAAAIDMLDRANVSTEAYAYTPNGFVFASSSYADQLRYGYTCLITVFDYNSIIVVFKESDKDYFDMYNPDACAFAYGVMDSFYIGK